MPEDRVPVIYQVFGKKSVPNSLRRECGDKMLQKKKVLLICRILRESLIRSSAVTYRMIMKLGTSHLGRGERGFSAWNKAKLKLPVTAARCVVSHPKPPTFRAVRSKKPSALCAVKILPSQTRSGREKPVSFCLKCNRKAILPTIKKELRSGEGIIKVSSTFTGQPNVFLCHVNAVKGYPH